MSFLLTPEPMRLLTFSLFTAIAGFFNFSFAQPGEVDWEHRVGGNSTDVFHCIFQASNGYLLAIGETESDTRGKSDGLVAILDFSTGQKLVEKRLGGAKADGLRAAVQTPDGFFLLAGFTESTGAGKRDGWLVKIDESAQVIWEAAFGGAGNDEFSYLLYQPDGSLVAVGRRDDGKNGDIWLAHLREQTLLNEYQIGRGHYDAVRGLAQSTDGQLAIAGNTGSAHKAGKGKAFLVKTEINGRLIWEKTYGEHSWNETSHLLATPDAGYVMAGTAHTGGSSQDMWMVKVNNAGFQQWQQTYGGKNEDLAQAVSIASDGGYLLAGYSKSYHSAARTFRGFVVKAGSGGERKWEWFYGGQRDDAFLCALVLHDGTVAAAGRTASDTKGGDDAWILRFRDQSQALTQVLGAKQAVLEHSEAVLQTTDGQLRPNERSHLSFTLFNQMQTAIQDVQIRVEQTKGSSGVRFWPQNYFGALAAGSARKVHIPVFSDQELDAAENDFLVTVSSGNQVINTFKAGFSSRRPQEAAVEVDNFTFEESRTSDDEKISVVLRNPGDFPASGVVVRFEPPAGIQSVSPVEVKIGQLGPHASQTVQFVFRRTPAFRSETLAVPCTVNFAGRSIRKTLERGSRSGPEVFMVLTQPNETETDIRNMISDKGVFDIQVAVGSNAALKQQNFKVLNNNLVVDGSKMDEVSLNRSNTAENQHAYVYSNRVHLQPGENRLEIEVETAQGNFRTKTIVVRYEPRQPNLHILAIGPTHQDLNFTSKDAADFAAAFGNQGGPDKIYGKVFIRSMTLPEETEAANIREAVADLVFQYQNLTAAQRILDQDVLIVFISSHGKNSREGFQLLPSNYDSRYERIRSIDFQRDVVQELERIHCKKIVFIDACHSGAADSKALTDMERADALTRLAALHPGLNTVASCGANEMSYEDSAWQNGAFTEGILEAFANAAVNSPQGEYRADADGNGIITLAELYDFLRQRVPQLVAGQKPGAPTRQTPFMPAGELDARQLPVFVVE
jgi:hypothetical protein